MPVHMKRKAILMMEVPKRRDLTSKLLEANADSEARLQGLVAWRALCDWELEAPTQRLQIRPLAGATLRPG
jgi:hypothetical protein